MICGDELCIVWCFTYVIGKIVKVTGYTSDMESYGSSKLENSSKCWSITGCRKLVNKWVKGVEDKAVTVVLLYMWVVLVCLVGYTSAFPFLVPEPPPISLLAPLPILSLILQMVINLPVQLFIWLFITKQPWSVCSYNPLVLQLHEMNMMVPI